MSAEKACDLTADLAPEERRNCIEAEQKYADFAVEHWAQLSPQLQTECNELANKDHFGEHNEILARCVDKHSNK